MTGYLSVASGVTQFYPTLPADHFVGERAITNVPSGQSILISAASFEAVMRKQGKPGQLFTPSIPEHIESIAVDPGGFMAQMRYNGYRFSWQTYIDWLHSFGSKLTWAALPDLPCEEELAADANAVRVRQETTLRYAAQVWASPDCDADEDTTSWRSQPWAWVPTVQGYRIDEYVWMANEMAPLLSSQEFQYDYMSYALGLIGDSLEDPQVIADTHETRDWAARCAAHRRVGIGSLCKRTDLVEACKIVVAVADVIRGVKFHLWGIDMRLIPLLQRAGVIGRIASFDTSAYNGRFGRDVQRVDAERKRLGLSQRAHADKVLLPRYSKKITNRLSQMSF